MSEKKKVETVDAAKVLEGVRGVVPPPSFGALFDGPLRGFWTSSGTPNAPLWIVRSCFLDYQPLTPDKLLVLPKHFAPRLPELLD